MTIRLTSFSLIYSGIDPNLIEFSREPGLGVEPNEEVALTPTVTPGVRPLA
jgi:hypothetical protein